MSKKIGIITIHNSPNYGASLQSFSLYYYLRIKGYDCEIIDLARPTHSDFIESKKYIKLVERKKNSYIEILKRKFKSLSFGGIYQKLFGKSNYSKKLLLKRHKFDIFNSQIKLSKRFCCIDDLYKSPPSYDIYLTGSDQVWNPGNGYAVEPYFLTFVNNKGRKIAYAPSFGITILPEDIKKKYRKWLSSYDSLSVREAEGRKLIFELTSKRVAVVLDPVFLLDILYWKSIARMPNSRGKYIFCFILNTNKALLTYAQKIREELGYDLVVISQNFADANSKGYQFIINAGPEDFLGWIENAEVVLSDSFHATAFSIMLAKNFFSYISPTSKRGSRITNLLKIFSLSEHLLNQGLGQKGEELAELCINRSLLNERVSVEQQKSRDFLLSAIEKSE